MLLDTVLFCFIEIFLVVMSVLNGLRFVPMALLGFSMMAKRKS